MTDAAEVMSTVTDVAGGLASYIPPSMYTANWWIEWFPIVYVTVFPFVNLLLAAVSACWKKLASMRKVTMKRAATRKVRDCYCSFPLCPPRLACVPSPLVHCMLSRAKLIESAPSRLSRSFSYHFPNHQLKYNPKTGKYEA